MLRIRLISVGRLRERFYIDACAEYEKRLRRYCTLECVELPETGDLRKEGADILAHIPRGTYTVALCVEGKLLSSEELAERIGALAADGESRIAFVIGSSEGLSDEVKRAADLRLSLSPMTFPHHLARVMVLEQIYRAFQILGGGKYHK